MMTNLLLYRFLIINIIAVLGLAVANTQGLVQPLFVNDFTYITWIASTLFLIAWGTTLKRVIRVSSGLNRIKQQGAYNYPQSQGATDKLWAKVAWLTDTSSWLVGLGLIGTIIGFRYALSGIDPNTLGDSRGVTDAIGPLMVGMKIALNTTIVGAILGTWNEVNQRMLRTAMTCMIADSNTPNDVTFEQRYKVLEEKYGRVKETPEEMLQRLIKETPGGGVAPV